MGRHVEYDAIYASDFETTVYDGQTETAVWSSAFVELWTEEVVCLTSIEDTLTYVKALGYNVRMYYHNLKFDGSFFLDYLLRQGYKQALWAPNPFTGDLEWLDDCDMCVRSFKYSISSKGQWYTFTIRLETGKYLMLLDSAKLMPFSLAEIGEAFKTKHQKTEMDYANHPSVYSPTTENEWEYIKNDVLVLKEALEFMFNSGNDKLTIGSCCMSEFKKMYRGEWNVFFPDQTVINIDSKVYGSVTADAYVRKSYKGAWTYLVPEKAGKVLYNGLTLDVNSLYSSVMHSKSWNRYPVGKGIFWSGDYIPDKALNDNMYYFIRVRTSFKLKEGYLPCIQIKGDWHYKPTKWLETSDYEYDCKSFGYKTDNTPITVVLTLTMTDWELIQEHYYLYNTTILDGVYYRAEIGLFDEYIDNYMEVKKVSTGAKRTEAKLFLNNLYGKLASSDDSSFKYAYMDEDGKIRFNIQEQHNKKSGYIPCGSAITSYARDFTIRHAQKNYHGSDKAGFAYADTDSLHMDGITIDDIVDINIHPTDLLCWKCESNWDHALFVRQKTYIEHITHEDQEPVEPRLSVTCAGMPKRCKKLLAWSIEQNYTKEDIAKMREEEIEFVKVKREISDFKVGLQVPSKLMPERVYGGIVLRNAMFTMHNT